MLPFDMKYVVIDIDGMSSVPLPQMDFLESDIYIKIEEKKKSPSFHLGMRYFQ